MRILLVIGQGDACVCHIEAVLGIRQATISQHLKILRDTGVVSAERTGRNIFYRLAVPELFDTIARVAALTGVDPVVLAELSHKPVMACPCPYCNPNQDPVLSCQKLNSGSQKLISFGD